MNTKDARRNPSHVPAAESREPIKDKSGRANKHRNNGKYRASDRRGRVLLIKSFRGAPELIDHRPGPSEGEFKSATIDLAAEFMDDEVSWGLAKTVVIGAGIEAGLQLTLREGGEA